MSLRPPNLDDRRFHDLVEEARHRIARSCHEWTDLSPGDPGVVLLEAFAHLTETMIYRLNRLPEKAYVEFLRLIGVKLQPPAAASATLRFTLSRPHDHPVEIKRGTRATTARSNAGSEPPVFTTMETVTIDAGATTVEALAHHCDLIDGELLGVGTGLPGLTLTTAQPPLIARTGSGPDLVLGVETASGEIDAHTPAIQHEGEAYHIWREVENFTNLGPDRCVYTTDRLAGTITFAPAVRMSAERGPEEAPVALAEVPMSGQEIRLWYRRGGGAHGNVAAHTLVTLKDSIPGVEVTNPAPATGGRSAETLDNALLRGPQKVHALQRAVTARDFELVAMGSSGAVDRAKAFTRAALWAHAQPGAVEVLLVPHVPVEMRTNGRVAAETICEHETEAAHTQIQRVLDERRPLGTQCLVNWARYKTASVKARVVVRAEEDPDAVKSRILRQLYQTINPLSTTPHTQGWTFGQPLTAWDVYKIVSAEPGVSSVGQVRLSVENVPNKNVRALAADMFQARTWYAGTGDTVFRSMNEGRGWEAVGNFQDEEVELIKAYPHQAGTPAGRAGLLAVAMCLPNAKQSTRLHISRDCGETWEVALQTRFRVEDMAWVDRDGVPSLLLATEAGLYELAAQEGAVPIQALVDPKNQELGFYAIAVANDVRGGTSVAVAARGEGGVYLSSDGGKPKTFAPIGLQGELVRVLAVQHRGPHSYLWAGVAVPGTAPGKGCFRWRLTGSTENPEGWRAYHKDWKAGGCRSLAFQGSKVLAASLRLGVLRLDVDARDPKWEAPDVGCGLPLRDVGRLQPVDVVASDPSGNVLLAGGVVGLYRSRDQGVQYDHCSSNEFSDEVTLPGTWLFCSGEHEITVVGEDEAGRD